MFSFRATAGDRNPTTRLLEHKRTLQSPPLTQPSRLLSRLLQSADLQGIALFVLLSQRRHSSLLFLLVPAHRFTGTHAPPHPIQRDHTYPPLHTYIKRVAHGACVFVMDQDAMEQYFIYENRLASFASPKSATKRRASHTSQQSRAPKSLPWPHKSISPEEVRSRHRRKRSC